VAKHGRSDILVNKVGRSEPGGPAEISEEVWDRQMDITLKSVCLFCHLVPPIMEKQAKGGVAVNVSSVAGICYIEKPRVGHAAAKAAASQLTTTTAVVLCSRKG
jgi:NAD(P)-dependent dehydrogenase (short-subunit alcohol dehydrogenase family)